MTLKVTLLPTGAPEQSVLWASSNESVATVDGGVVTAKGVGTTTITATTVEGNAVATYNLEVIDDTPIPSTGMGSSSIVAMMVIVVVFFGIMIGMKTKNENNKA